MELPEAFVLNIRNTYKEKGEEWLRDLPSLLETCALRWNLTLLPPFGLSFNYVATAVRPDGTTVVLKTGPRSPEQNSEREALRLYEGQGAVRLLEADTEAGAFLLEHILPGTVLAGHFPERDEEATRILAGVMRRLWKPAPPDSPLIPLLEWTGALDTYRAERGNHGPLPLDRVEHACTLRDELLASSGPAVVLHGDLHHENVLRCGDDWLVIDPKGLAGEREFEVGSLFYNPMPQLFSVANPEQVTARRLAILAEELNLDVERLRMWGFVQSVLSACWSAEDGSDTPSDTMIVAEWISAGKF